MPIKVPEKHQSKILQGKTALKVASSHGKRSGYTDLLLTPMVDMFVLLVVFLLANFSATGEILFMTKDIRLPDSSSIKELDRTTLIAITATSVSCEAGNKQEVVADTEDLLRGQDMRIPALTDMLTTVRESWNLTHRGGEEFKGDVILQADQSIDFRVIKKVMFAAVQAGFTNFSYAVMQAGKTAAAHGTDKK